LLHNILADFSCHFDVDVSQKETNKSPHCEELVQYSDDQVDGG
jgi:hypothetical protein